jgi:ankyrin repeat protein
VLKEAGLDLKKKDKFGQTIVHYAARSGRLGLLKYLATLENF